MIEKKSGMANETARISADHLRILLAEDNASNQKVIMKMLERLGYKADAVLNGCEVIQALELQHYDLVLMDVVMPKMSGFDAAKEIRRRIPASEQPRIIALTAYVIPNSRQICLEAGMDDYLGKPVTIQELSNVISKNMQSVKPT